MCIGNCKLSSIHFLWPPSTLIFSIVANYTITFAAVLNCDLHPLCQFSIFWLFLKDDHLHFRSVMMYISCNYFSWNMWSFPTWTTWIAHAIQLDNQIQMHACLLWFFLLIWYTHQVKFLLHHHLFSNNDKFSSSIICIFIFLHNLRIFIRIGKIEQNNSVFFPYQFPSTHCPDKLINLCIHCSVFRCKSIPVLCFVSCVFVLYTVISSHTSTTVVKIWLQVISQPALRIWFC